MFRQPGCNSLQIHLLKNGNVCVFSRNCENRSQAFPDVATAIRTAAEGAAPATYRTETTHMLTCRIQDQCQEAEDMSAADGCWQG